MCTASKFFQPDSYVTHVSTSIKRVGPQLLDRPLLQNLRKGLVPGGSDCVFWIGVSTRQTVRTNAKDLFKFLDEGRTQQGNMCGLLGVLNQPKQINGSNRVWQLVAELARFTRAWSEPLQTPELRFLQVFVPPVAPLSAGICTGFAAQSVPKCRLPVGCHFHPWIEL